MSETWEMIKKEYLSLVGKRYLHNEDGKVYTFFGLVDDGEDYSYGMIRKNGKIILVSCCGDLSTMGFKQLD